MTARRALPRPGRAPVRGAPRVHLRAGALPSAEHRRKHGPQPPDVAIRTLRASLATEIRALQRHDATDPEGAAPRRLGARWKAALALALASLSRGARRGVVAALQGLARAAARETPDPDPEDWEETTTAAVEASIARATRAPWRPGVLTAILAAAAGVAAAAVLREHARQVQIIARAAGSARYIWTTRRDERVRRLHAELEGTVQRWDSPPLAGLPDFHGHPGEAGGCRCTPWPLV